MRLISRELITGRVIAKTDNGEHSGQYATLLPLGPDGQYVIAGYHGKLEPHFPYGLDVEPD